MKRNPITLIVLTSLAVAFLSAAASIGARSDALPANVAQSVERAFPNAKVHEVDTERHVIRLYEVTISVNGHRKEVLVTADGTILEAEEKLDPAIVPESVRSALPKGALIKELERVEVHSESRNVAVRPARIEYEVEFVADGREREIRVSSGGEPLASHDEDEVTMTNPAAKHRAANGGKP